MRRDDRVRDREPEAGAGGIRDRRAPVEGLEDALAIVGGDPGPWSVTRTSRMSSDGATESLHLAAGRRVTGGVLEQVRHDLVELHLVDRDRGHVVVDVEHDPHVAEPRHQPGDDDLGDLVEARLVAGGDQGARTDAREVEDVADQPVQAVGLLEDRREQLPLLRSDRAPRWDRAGW